MASIFNLKRISVCLVMLACLPTLLAAVSSLRWQQLPPPPDQLGVAGAFAGVSGGALLVAGGANFPDGMPWEGGKNVWHDTVFAPERPNGRWEKAGRLPRPLSYGLSVSHADAVICVGGSDAARHYAEVFRLRRHGGGLVTEPLPGLPVPLANMSGAVVSNLVYVAGGTETPGELRATGRFFALDLGARHPVWQELEPVPGRPRLLAAAAAHGGAFYLFGGVALELDAEGKASRVYLREVHAPRATAPCVEWRGMFVVPSGEVRPGVRSPEVWGVHPG